MNDLDLALRTVGRSVLLEPRAARAMISRMLDAPRSRGGLVGRLARAVGLADDEAARAPAKPEAYAPSPDWAPEAETCAGYALVDGIAVIVIEGVLTPKGYFDWWSDTWFGGYRGFGAAIRAARADGRVSGILLLIDSPGGLVTECFELVTEIRAGSARSGGKPIWAHTSGVMCSAAYAIACSCDRVLAGAEAEVGSIGVVILHVDQSEMLAEWGLKVEAIESAPGKTGGAPFKPLDDATRAHLQSDVNELARRFVAAVSAGRGLSEEAVRAQDARYFLGEHADPKLSAKALGLVDEIMTERAAAAALIASLSPIDEIVAPAAAGATRHATRKDMDMSKLDAGAIAALEAAAEGGDEAADDKLSKIRAILDEDDNEEEGDGEASTEDDADPEAAATPKTPKAKAGGKATAKTGVGAAMAVIDLPEAKGREGLARQLAEKVGAGAMSVDDAKAMLASAPKASRLGDHMAGRDQGLSPGAGGDKPDGLAAAVDRLNATASKRRA